MLLILYGKYSFILSVQKHEKKSTIGSPKCRWKNYIKIYYQKILENLIRRHLAVFHKLNNIMKWRQGLCYKTMFFLQNATCFDSYGFTIRRECIQRWWNDNSKCLNNIPSTHLRLLMTAMCRNMQHFIKKFIFIIKIVVLTPWSLFKTLSDTESILICLRTASISRLLWMW